MIRDLTEGRLFRVLLLFSLPMFFSMLFQQIYNLADSLIAGRFISEAALGAVGTCYPWVPILRQPGPSVEKTGKH